MAVEEEEKFIELVNSAKERLKELKMQVIYQLSLYSSLLETNSYYICLNNYLVICRFVPIAPGNTEYEIKLYTISPTDLPGDYKEKLFLGRDLLSLASIPRDYLGLQNITSFLSEQIKKLERRCKNILPRSEFGEIRQEYLKEIEELFTDMCAEVDHLTQNFPPRINQSKMAFDQVLEYNRRFRELKHILIDIQITAQELERLLFSSKEQKAVRYVTKFHKDVTNYINYITFKVNGRISDALNGFHVFDRMPRAD